MKALPLRWLLAGALVLLAGTTLFLARPRPSSSPPPPEIPRAGLILKEGRLFQEGAPGPFTGWMRETNASGGLLSRSSISNGVLEGVSEGYHTNGQLQVVEHFRAGVSHGPRTKWHANGTKASVAQVIDGKLDGWFIRWAEDGSLAEEMPMKGGNVHGVSRSYYPSGCLKGEARLRNGTLVEQQFWPDGERRLRPLTATGP